MRAEAIIDLSAIKHNVELLKNTSGTNLLAVVKADAYGHGLLPVAHSKDLPWRPGQSNYSRSQSKEKSIGNNVERRAPSI